MIIPSQKFAPSLCAVFIPSASFLPSLYLGYYTHRVPNGPLTPSSLYFIHCSLLCRNQPFRYIVLPIWSHFLLFASPLEPHCLPGFRRGIPNPFRRHSEQNAKESRRSKGSSRKKQFLAMEIARSSHPSPKLVTNLVLFRHKNEGLPSPQPYI